ncbi:UvrD-helicase domain-containing protein [Leifsonia sp. P73]|uniref:UvrD-helicase domain-containing protein n=1 Tax=Leifsonia sp. P73 TaxID=3423959 RepID=UPI003DA63444
MSTRGFRPRVDDAAGGLAVALDDAQRAVLSLPDGASAAVLGAPGTGKTTALVEAIAERVHERGYAASEVLALSASRTAATALRDRISLRLGVPTPGPLARTATSLAFQLSGEQARRNGWEPPRLLTGGEQDQIIAELLTGHLEDGTGPVWPPSLGPEVRILRGFRTELRELIGRCAERGVSPSRLAELGAITGRDEWRAAGRFIAEYQNVLDSFRGGYVDSAELIASAVPVVAEGAASTASERCSSTTSRKPPWPRSRCCAPSRPVASRSSRSATPTSRPRPSAARRSPRSASSVRGWACP